MKSNKNQMNCMIYFYYVYLSFEMKPVVIHKNTETLKYKLGGFFYSLFATVSMCQEEETIWIIN